jgi:hypothetical protein
MPVLLEPSLDAGPDHRIVFDKQQAHAIPPFRQAEEIG